MRELRVRNARDGDERHILNLLDEAVEWMLARGQEGQWGRDQPSRTESWQRRVSSMLEDYETDILELDGTPVGALATGPAPDYAPPVEAPQPELYVNMLLTARSHKGEDLGGQLLKLAERRARRRGLSRMRVDCWAGAPTLVGWYERNGFVRVSTFMVGDWRGQLFERVLDP
jgi:GNAT superfamily N-acetyltransferase